MNSPTPVTRTQDLGSAKEGVKHWWGQRISSVALVPLALWLIFSLASLSDLSHPAIVQWFAMPINSFLMIAFLIIAYYHMALGVRIILEDYVHLPWLKICSIVLMELLAFMLALSSIISVLKLFL